MFGARKKFVEFVEVVDNDFSDEGMYYNQPSMFPHRSDKDVSLFPDIRMLLSLSSGGVLPGDLTPSRLLIFFFRCFHLPRHRRRVSCRSSVQVCTVHKVSFCFPYSSFLTCCIFWVDQQPWLGAQCWYLRGSLASKVRATRSLDSSLTVFVFLPRLSAGALGFSVRGMGNNTPQLNRNLTQGTQLPSHITPTTGVPTMSLHTPPSPSRCVRRSSLVLWVSLNMCGLLWFVTWTETGEILNPLNESWWCFNRGTLPMNTRNMLNHSQVGQGIGMSGRTNSMGSSGLGSPNRSSPSIICMPKQQPARQPFTINRYTDTHVHLSDTHLYRCAALCPVQFLK